MKPIIGFWKGEINKPLARLTTEKRKSAQLNKGRNEKRRIKTDATETQKQKLREYYEHLNGTNYKSRINGQVSINV